MKSSSAAGPITSPLTTMGMAGGQAVFATQETIPAGSALGRVCALPTVSCPPAIPIVVSGEVIGPAALELFTAYGVETVSVVKPEKI